ncbi:MAG: acyltransferase [Planctomycetes bacterium]|nr:acyltransferase [Planctomycetota bacterium]
MKKPSRKHIDTLLAQMDEYLFNFVINFLPDDVLFNAFLRPAIARIFGLRCGKQCYIMRSVFFEYRRNLVLGANVWLNKQGYIDAIGGIKIGDNVRFGPQVTLITGSHETNDPNMRAGKTTRAPIVIEDGCWIGTRVTITAGVSIGKGSVVSAGSVVLRSMPPNYLIAGNPARPVSQLVNGKI